MQTITREEREKAFHSAKKPDVINKQRLPVRYHVEDFDVEDRPRRFLQAFATILKHTNYRLALDQYVRVSAKCGRCTAKCQVYLATGDPRDLPCQRSELLLSVYRRHFTVSGTLRARLLGAPGLTDENLQEMAEAFYNCTACRRCHFECPMGIDHALITHLGRYILSEIGIAPRALVVSTREQLIGASGNTSAVPVAALVDTLEFLSEEIKEGIGVDVPLPVDQQEAEYVFFAPVSDYIMEAETLMGNAAVFRATGDRWTIGTGYFDGINYGLFYNDQVMEHVLRKVQAEVKRLHGKKILIGECGHASRTAKYFYPTFCGGRQAEPVINIHGIHAQSLAGRPSQAQAQHHHRARYLPRPVQYRPSGLDCGAAARAAQGILQRLCRDDAQPARQHLLRRRQRHGLDRRDKALPHAGWRPRQGRADQGHRGQVLRGALRQLQEAVARADGSARHRLPDRRAA